VTDQPEQPEGQADNQELSLDEQLDALIKRLEEVEPSLVPADLRQNPPQEPTPAQEPAPEPQPAAEPVTAEATPDTPEEPDAPQDAGLEAQLDTLLNEISPETPAATEQEPAPKPVEAVKAVDTEVDLDSVEQLASDLIDQQIDSATQPDKQPEETEAKPTESVTLSEDDLSSQIESLLKDAQLTGSGEAPPAEPVKAEPPAAEAEPKLAQTVPQTPDTSADPAPAEGSGSASIEQIDAMLADSAEQAIEKASTETVAETPRVPGTDEVLAQQAKAEEEAQAQKQSAEPPTPPETAPVQTAGATAEDVARELDEDAEASPQKTPEQAQTVTEPQQPAEVGAPTEVTAVTKPGNLRKAERAMFYLCKTINRPANFLSPEMRDNIGYVGVLTTAVGCFVLLYGVLF